MVLKVEFIERERERKRESAGKDIAQISTLTYTSETPY
jgi:hypothetical protein